MAKAKKDKEVAPEGSEQQATSAKALTKDEIIQGALANINKKYGPGTVRRMGDKWEPVPVFSSGILSLDLALGGGVPVGRIVEIFGPEMGGKTAIATYMGIQVQKTREANLIDVEQTFNPIPAQRNGLDIARLYLCQPETGEQAFDVMESLALTCQFGISIFDSVAAAEPQAHAEKEMGDSGAMGVHAKMMSECLRRIVPVMSRTKCTAVFINQIREKPGTMFGNPETTPGGRALKFYSSIRLEVRPCMLLGPDGKEVKSKEEAAGHRIKVKVVKNKVAPPFRTAEFDFYYGIGVDLDLDLVSVASELGVIKRGGAWYTYETIKQQGIGNMCNAIRDANLFEEIREKTLGVIRQNTVNVMNDGGKVSEDEPYSDEQTSEPPAGNLSSVE